MLLCVLHPHIRIFCASYLYISHLTVRTTCTHLILLCVLTVPVHIWSCCASYPCVFYNSSAKEGGKGILSLFMILKNFLEKYLRSLEIENLVNKNIFLRWKCTLNGIDISSKRKNKIFKNRYRCITGNTRKMNVIWLTPKLQRWEEWWKS